MQCPPLAGRLLGGPDHSLSLSLLGGPDHCVVQLRANGPDALLQPRHRRRVPPPHVPRVAAPPGPRRPAVARLVPPRGATRSDGLRRGRRRAGRGGAADGEGELRGGVGGSEGGEDGLQALHGALRVAAR